MVASPVNPANLLEALRAVLSQVAEPVQVLRAILELAVSQTEANRGVFVEVKQGGELDYRVLHRFERKQLMGEKGTFSRTIFANVLKTGEPLLLENALDHPSFQKSQSVGKFRITYVLCAPIRGSMRSGRSCTWSIRSRGHFRPRHQALLGSLVEVAGPLLEALRTGGAVLKAGARRAGTGATSRVTSSPRELISPSSSPLERFRSVRSW
jgi:hypothetical protein